MDPQLAALDRTLKALADPTRVRILGLLRGGEVCVCHIHESLGVSQSKASRHLAYLRRSGLVKTDRRGLWVYYRLAPHAHASIQAVVDAVDRCAGHLPTARRDATRLENRTGCCVPEVRSQVRSLTRFSVTARAFAPIRAGQGARLEDVLPRDDSRRPRRKKSSTVRRTT
jgi:ArsR family transcriptional regulator